MHFSSAEQEHDAGKDRHSTDGHISAIFQKGGVEAHGYDTFTSLHDKDGRTECQTWQDIGGLQTEVFHTDAESCPLAEAKRPALIGILAEDPRPGYQHDPDRRYGVAFAGFDVRFHINGNVLTVCEVVAV